ncbi:hypothetical protein Ancab_012436 [Ancistrocladus abbreviatus]
MGDKMENEHITIPMATYESSSKPLRTFENVNPEILHHDTSQLTPSGDASSVAEPPPPSGNAQPMEGAASKDEKWTPTYTCLVAVVCVLCIILLPLCLLCAMGAFLFCNKDLTEEKPEEHSTVEGTKQSIYQKVQEFQGTAFHIAKMVSVIHSRIMIGLLTWLIINLSIKSLRRKIILGSHLWQWTLGTEDKLQLDHLLNHASPYMAFLLTFSQKAQGYGKTSPLAYWEESIIELKSSALIDARAIKEIAVKAGT